jgi:HPt (histidine-containing phosphotransfer) domain-containing protein
MPWFTGRAAPVLHGPSLDRLRTTFSDPTGLQEILQEFLVSSSRLVRQMTRARRSGRTLDVERAAHTLKSMARLIGAQELAEACRAVEFLAHGPSPPPIPAHLVDKVEVHTRQAQEAVQRLLR